MVKTYLCDMDVEDTAVEIHSKMLEMETKKSAFVADLARVLKNNNVCDVRGMTYLHDRETEEEYVTVRFRKDGDGYEPKKTVCVTGDSLMAIMEDVIHQALM